MADDMADHTAGGKTDQERIQALVAQGKITQEEATRLLSALKNSEIEETGEAEREAEREAARESPRAEVVREARDVARAALARAQKKDDLPQGLRWVRASMLTGDLNICVDPALSEPEVDGEAAQFEVKRDGGDFVIRPLKRKKDKVPRREGLDGLVDGVSEFVGGLFERMGDLKVRIPAGFGVVVDSKAGDVRVSGAPFVKARLLAGDLNVQDVGGVDLGLSAGDVNASVRLTKGEHRVKLSAGDLNITLLEGSSVRVTGGISMGDADADAPLSVRRTGMGGSLVGQVGGGEASLEVSVSAGDLEVRCG